MKLLGVTALLVGTSLFVPINGTEHLDNEIKKHEIVRDGADKLLGK